MHDVNVRRVFVSSGLYYTTLKYWLNALKMHKPAPTKGKIS